MENFMSSGMWFWVLVFSVPIVSIIFSSMETISRNRMVARLIENDKPIPPELLRGIRDRHGRAPSLQRGIILAFIGMGLVIFFWGLTGAGGHIQGLLTDRNLGWLPVVGVIPFMIGLGMIVASFFQEDEGRKE